MRLNNEAEISKTNPRKNRPGAGRQIGPGKFRESITVVRIPESQAPVIKDFLVAIQSKKLIINLDVVTDFVLPTIIPSSIKLPIFSSKVSAGFPSPAEDHIEKRLSPDDYLIDQKDATFFVTIQGQSMIDVGLLPGDKAVVDRSKKANVGDIVLAVVDGEFTIKTLARSKDGNACLLPANCTGAYSPIEIKEGMSFEVWGVVTGSFRRFR